METMFRVQTIFFYLKQEKKIYDLAYLLFFFKRINITEYSKKKEAKILHKFESWPRKCEDHWRHLAVVSNTTPNSTYSSNI